MTKKILTYEMIVTLLNAYFIGCDIIYRYDKSCDYILLCEYHFISQPQFKKLNKKQLINDFKFYILSSKYERDKMFKTLNKITFFK